MAFKMDNKLLVRVLLILASLCMVISNIDRGYFAFLASSLFLIANIMALVINIKK